VDFARKNNMKIPYRVTSGIALGTLLLDIAWEFLAMAPQRHIPASVDGAMGWDPCSLWVQQPAMAKLLAVLCFGVYLFFVVQGSRNRPGPRWFAIIGVPAFVLLIASDWWRISAGCYSTPNLVGLFTWVGAAELMLLHHAVRPRTQLQDRSLRTAIYRNVVPAFLWTPVAWSLVNWLRVLTPDRDPPLIGAVEHCISWGALILFPLAVAVGLRAATKRAGKPSF
jgi:hypothetical protein